MHRGINLHCGGVIQDGPPPHGAAPGVLALVRFQAIGHQGQQVYIVLLRQAPGKREVEGAGGCTQAHMWAGAGQ